MYFIYLLYCRNRECVHIRIIPSGTGHGNLLVLHQNLAAGRSCHLVHFQFHLTRGSIQNKNILRRLCLDRANYRSPRRSVHRSRGTVFHTHNRRHVEIAVRASEISNHQLIVRRQNHPFGRVRAVVNFKSKSPLGSCQIKC